MYFILGLSIVLATLLVLNNLASLLALLLWRVFAGRISRWSASSSAQTLFLLRTVPVALGIGCVLFLFAPAYLRNEPRVGHEDVSLKLAVLAAFSAISIAFALGRGIASWRATARLTADWLRSAEPVRIPNLSIPSYQIEHGFPLIAVVGALRPRLFIAKQIFQSLTPDEMAAALEHEVGHVMAHDNLKRGMVRACRDILIIPCGRRLDNAWLQASEVAADEYAFRSDRRIGLDLASALVKIARLIPSGAKPTMTAGAFLVSEEEGLGFKVRVRRLVQLANAPQQQKTHFGLSSQLPKLIPVAITLLLIALLANQQYVLPAVQSIIEHTVYILD